MRGTARRRLHKYTHGENGENTVTDTVDGHGTRSTKNADSAVTCHIVETGTAPFSLLMQISCVNIVLQFSCAKDEGRFDLVPSLRVALAGMLTVTGQKNEARIAYQEIMRDYFGSVDPRESQAAMKAQRRLERLWCAEGVR